MRDSRKPPSTPQVKPKRQVEFDLEPCVQELCSQGLERSSAMLAITAVVIRLFPHWAIKDDPARGLYAIVGNPKVLARIKRRG